MKATALSMATLVNERGHELDVGELVTYLNDAILMAPSMLLGPKTSWHALSDNAFEVRFRDCGHVVTAQVTVDERGAPREFATNDRFIQDPYNPDHPFVRARWSTPVNDGESLTAREASHGGHRRLALASWRLQLRANQLRGGQVTFDVAPETAAMDQRKSARRNVVQAASAAKVLPRCPPTASSSNSSTL